ncbi:MAG: potassium channel family protein [Candidatus Paceibacterota bacterium]
MEKNIVVFGYGHLAERTAEMLETKGFQVWRSKDKKEGVAGKDIVLNAQQIFIVDDNDDKNLEFLVAINAWDSSAKIAIAIFNAMIAGHIQGLHPSLTVISPAKVSAQTFAQAVDQKNNRLLSYVPPTLTARSDSLLPWKVLTIKLIIAFVVMVSVSTTFFCLHNRLSVIDSLYFVIVTIAGVGYGDITMLHEGNSSKIAVTMLIIASMTFLAVGISLITNELLKQRDAAKFGIKKYSMRNHVIVCGLGRLGYCVAELLLQKKYKVLIIEKDKESPHLQYFKSLGAHFYVGDAALPATLLDANVHHAQALISLVNYDSKNLQIGLSARSLNPQLSLVLRIYEKITSEEIKQFFDIQLTYSVSEITAEILIEKMLTTPY